MHSHLMSVPGGEETPGEDAGPGWFAPVPSEPWGPPDNEVPGQVAGPTLLSRTEDLALALWSVRAYRRGVRFSLRLLVRGPQTLARRHQDVFETWQRMLVGLELADGRRLLADGPPAPTLPGGEPAPHLVGCGGGGGDRSFSSIYWLTPLPPDGDLTLVTACLQLGLPESRHVIAGTDLRRAADAAVELWPWEPDPMPDVDPGAPVQIPPGGWFAETVGTSEQ